MPSFNIIKHTKPSNSFRSKAIIGAFDLQNESLVEKFEGEIPLETIEWNVGLIVGGSGTGKTTIAKEIFKENYIKSYQYQGESIIDDMPNDKTVKEIEKAFTCVGFSSPPSWLKPYHVLSNGEQMRVDLARSLLEEREVIVFDEFTSVVNREVAKTSSYAISKAIKNQNKKFVAVSCHKDIIEWLQPDWIYDTDEQCFFIQRESSTAQNLNLKYIGLTKKLKSNCGTFLESITI